LNFQQVKSLFNKRTSYQHIVFWLLVVAYSTTVLWQSKKNFDFAIHMVLAEVVWQVTIAYVILYFLIPKFLNKKQYVQFWFLVLMLVFIAHLGFSMYLDAQLAEEVSEDSYPIFWERLTNGYRYLRATVNFLTPAALLLLLVSFKKQKETAILLEQKKTNELKLLKNQLNPHFLFNTLNNVYTLALKKSDQTADVIAKLSDILDYTLYRCEQNYVSLHDEVILLENYIALEQIRYGKRVKVLFDKDYENQLRVAPLLLLALLENAYKHGISQDINQGYIEINLKADNQAIEFSISNSKPLNAKLSTKGTLGLPNIKQQLELLYPNRHEFTIDDSDQAYTAQLKISLDDI
jgi:sensor histidine kinase YesM